MMSLEWNGAKIIEKFVKAVEQGVNETMAASVKRAKFNHPGWKNITGTAEGSIRIQEFAKTSPGSTVGKWGSVNVKYMLPLEIFHGSALRNASDAEYPKLASRIKKAFKSRGGK